MGFSVEGSDSQKKAMVQDAISKFGLSLDTHFAAFFGDAVRYGRSFDGCLVGETGANILTVGGSQSPHFVLPDDYEKALEAIGRFFYKI